MSPFARRLCLAAFGASLALNLVLGLRMTVMRPEPPGPPSLERMRAHILRALPEADREAFARAMAPDWPGLQADFEAVRAARAGVDGVILAGPFDEAAAQAAFRDWNAQWRGTSDRFSAALVKGLAAVSPEGRRAFVESLPREKE